MSKHPYVLLLDAVDADSAPTVEGVLRDHPGMRSFRVPGVGGTWLHHAAAYGTPSLISWFVQNGFDVNSTEQMDGARPIVAAAQLGRTENVACLLGLGALLDTRSSAVNPLFGAVVGRSPEVARVLLDRGIDASVRYTEGWNNMDALGFASMQGEMEIAEMIADHLAGGDAEKKRELLEQGRATAKANVDPLPPHGRCPDLGEEE